MFEETDEECHARLEREHKELLERHDWIDYSNKFRRFLIWLFRRVRWAGWTSLEDATCAVYCSCGNNDLFMKGA